MDLVARILDGLDDGTLAGLSPGHRAQLIEELRDRRPDLVDGGIEFLPYRRGSAFVGRK